MDYNGGVSGPHAATAPKRGYFWGLDQRLAIEQRSNERLIIAEKVYRAWLESSGISNDQARLESSRSLGYVGLREQDHHTFINPQKHRSAHPNLRTKGAYDILPPELLVQINAIASGVGEVDAALIRQFTGIDVSSLSARELKKLLLN